MKYKITVIASPYPNKHFAISLMRNIVVKQLIEKDQRRGMIRRFSVIIPLFVCPLIFIMPCRQGRYPLLRLLSNAERSISVTSVTVGKHCGVPLLMSPVEPESFLPK